MATRVEMPKLGNTVEECLLATWLKHPGDIVAAGEVIAEAETDKTTFELTAPVAGVILEKFCEEGALVPVFSAVCTIGDHGEAPDGPTVPAAGLPQTVAGNEPPHRGSERPTAAADPAPASNEHSRNDEPANSTEAAQGVRGARPGAAMSPRARRFAHEHGYGRGLLKGSGPGGRVLEADVRDALFASERGRQEQALPAIAPSVEARSTDAARSTDKASPSAGAPLTSVRDRIAKRLRQSLGTTAQYTLHGSARAGEVLALRRELKASPALAHVNINDIVVFCAVQALLEVPALNATLVDGMLQRHSDVNIGFACDTERGLMVPVVRAAQDYSLPGLARRMKSLAAQAAEGTVGPDDLSEGTFTVSNLGSLGVEWFTPVLNPPQLGILGIGSIELKPVRKEDGNVEFVDALQLSLTLDHQVIDGAPGARFLAVVRQKIEGAKALCTTW